MRGTWIFALLITAGVVAAGFFAQGMARLAGLPGSAPRPISVAHATSGPTSSLPAAAPVAVETTIHSNEAASVHTPPAELAVASPALPAQTTAPDRAPEAPAATVPRARPVPASAVRRVAVAETVEPAARSLSAADVHDAQCRSLRDWLAELDAVAQARPDAGSLAWVQSQRATTRDRQSELRC